MPTQVITKPSADLTENELSQIKESILREFKIQFENTKEKLFFLLEDDDTILAMGALWKIEPVVFNGETFTIYGVVNVIANSKGKGHGKQIGTAIKNHLASHNKTGLGFCMPKNAEFYKKCGFSIDDTSTQRFIYTKGTEKIANQDGQLIFYHDSSDEFMKKVLTNSDKEVSIPTEELW